MRLEEQPLLTEDQTENGHVISRFAFPWLTGCIELFPPKSISKVKPRRTSCLPWKPVVIKRKLNGRWELSLADLPARMGSINSLWLNFRPKTASCFQKPDSSDVRVRIDPMTCQFNLVS